VSRQLLLSTAEIESQQMLKEFDRDKGKIVSAGY
jgi:hypothetical protein